MATMTKAQLVAECCELRKENEQLTAQIEESAREITTLRAELAQREEELSSLPLENAQLRQQLRSAEMREAAQRTVPDWQQAAAQRREAFFAAQAAGRRVKYVGTVLTEY